MKKRNFFKALAALIAAPFLPKPKIVKPKDGSLIYVGTSGNPDADEKTKKIFKNMIEAQGDGWRHGLHAEQARCIESKLESKLVGDKYDLDKKVKV